ncbi:MAG: CoA pyrophosphatase [Planctomycetota bacterium]|nr:CoA pyrophosphatase [Planctomycetota bacterium]
MSKTDLDSSNLSEYTTGIQVSLQSAVSGGLNLKTRSREMTPHLAYGRHRGPIPKRVRRAAVMVAIYRHPDLGWVVPLTLRPMHLDHHPGQICFPGGQVESGEDDFTAAAREFEEELGCSVVGATRVGKLSSQYVYASNNHVVPVVVVMSRPDKPWDPDPKEVAEVIEFPIDQLTNPKSQVMISHTVMVRSESANRGKKQEISAYTEDTRDLESDTQAGFTFQSPAFQYGGYSIWGATAMMLHELSLHLPKADGVG